MTGIRVGSRTCVPRSVSAGPPPERQLKKPVRRGPGLATHHSPTACVGRTEPSVSSHRAARSSRISKPGLAPRRRQGWTPPGPSSGAPPTRAVSAATVGGVALFVAAAGAANAGQSVPENESPSERSRRHMARTSAACPRPRSPSGRQRRSAGRGPSRPDIRRQSASGNGQVSRSSSRNVTPAKRLVNAAEELAAERQDVLRTTADDAEELRRGAPERPVGRANRALRLLDPVRCGRTLLGIRLSHRCRPLGGFGQPVVAPATGVISRLAMTAPTATRSGSGSTTATRSGSTT